MFRADPSAEGALTNMIANVIKRENISPERIFLSLSRSDVLARELVLPPMKSDELEEVLVSEIEKIPTFSENSFDYVYQKFDISKENANVIFAALNKKILSYILDETQKTKIPFLHFDITPLNIPQVVDADTPLKDNQAFLLINDMVSHLIIYRQNKYKLFYKTTSGTNHLVTNNVLNERNIATLAGEIQRVLKAYLHQNKQEKVEDLLVLWDKSVAPELIEEFQKNFDLKIEPFDLKKYITIEDASAPEGESTVSLDNPVYFFPIAGIYGEHRKTKFHFPLDHFFRDFHVKKCLWGAIMCSLLFIAISGLFIGRLCFGLHQKKIKTQQAIENVQWEKEDLKTATKELYDKRDQYLTVRQGLLDQATFLKVINRIYWTDVLGVVAKNIPNQLSLVSFQMKENGQVVFKGESMTIESVSELIRRVDGADLLNNGRFDYLTEKMIQEQKVFSFGIMAQLKQMTLEEIEAEDLAKEKDIEEGKKESIEEDTEEGIQ